MKFEFSEEEIKYMFNVLGKRPYDECISLMNKIVDQVNNQEEEKEEK